MDVNASSQYIFPSAPPQPQNNRGFIPYPGMSIGPMTWIPAYGPQPNATVQVKDESTFQYNEGASIAPAHVPVASSGVGAGDAQNVFQAAPHSVVNIGNATYNQSFINPYSPNPATAAPPQYSFMSSQQYPQAAFPLGQPPIYVVPQQLPFPGQNIYPPQYIDALPAPTVSLPSEATAPSTGPKRRKGRKKDRKLWQLTQISEDADFEPTGEKDRRGIQKFQCLRKGCGKTIMATSYEKHIKTASHRGDTSCFADCPICGRRLSRNDAVKRHLTQCLERRARALAAETSEDSTSLSPMAVPTAPFTYDEHFTYEPTTGTWVPSVSPTYVETMQMAPSADEVTQSSNTTLFMDHLPDVPESSESPETTAEAAANDGLPFTETALFNFLATYQETDLPLDVGLPLY
ncbi:hypothetical protein K503DRAFT_799566 [Rhizopogon vinicolor AM-OR11-026]|uniref:Uncharacterized protein n=1 Tax=Rhizopogon vinicolor AM-OR11-026 TaxID=1314800 RepID=A0A1B7N3X8_9AGAM|nr:hypothetical protein K503DRAFT_799566 [Rhizopogon vinicolor AM-OR11-026]